MKKFKCDFCGAEIAAGQGKPVFCKKCNCDYSAEEVDKKLKETSKDEFINHSPVDKETQRRIMINNLEKRKNALESNRRIRFVLMGTVVNSLYVVGLIVVLIMLLVFHFLFLIFGILGIGWAYGGALKEYSNMVRTMEERPNYSARRDSGKYFRPSKNLEFYNKQMLLAEDYSNFEKEKYYIRCIHCDTKLPITSETHAVVCPHCKKLTIL